MATSMCVYTINKEGTKIKSSKHLRICMYFAELCFLRFAQMLTLCKGKRVLTWLLSDQFAYCTTGEWHLL